ncbi:alpha-ketoglutarate-dependent dioxygenase alkB 2 [Cladorrhinum sp. PSN259]|nr:alpha-ketoglutarate-dependent dioxygenase alkB 2 [Cladorrhinum sp. PSN259]
MLSYACYPMHRRSARSPCHLSGHGASGIQLKIIVPRLCFLGGDQGPLKDLVGWRGSGVYSVDVWLVNSKQMSIQHTRADRAVEAVRAGRRTQGPTLNELWVWREQPRVRFCCLYGHNVRSFETRRMVQSGQSGVVVRWMQAVPCQTLASQHKVTSAIGRIVTNPFPPFHGKWKKSQHPSLSGIYWPIHESAKQDIRVEPLRTAPRPAMRPTFSFNPAAIPAIRTRKALLVVDLQNDFLSPDGALTVTEPEGFVKRALELVKEFRDSGAGDVVWVRSEFERHRPLSGQGDQIVTSSTPPRPQRPDNARGRQQASREHDGAAMEADEEAFLSVAGRKPAKTCVQKGSRGAEFPSNVQEAVEATRDILFTKTHYSAFSSAQQELVQRLRGRFVTELYICGALTNISIYATALEAARHGYEMTIVEDCCGFRSQLRHFNAVRQLVKLTGCEVMNADVLVEQLQPPATTTATQSGLSPHISNIKLNLASSGAPETAPATSKSAGPTPSANTAPPQPDRDVSQLAASTPPSEQARPRHVPDDTTTSTPRPLSDRHPREPFGTDSDPSPSKSESPAGTSEIGIEARRGSALARTSKVDESERSSKGAPRAPGNPSTKAENPRVKVSARLRLRRSSSDKSKNSQSSSSSSSSSSPEKTQPKPTPVMAEKQPHQPKFVCSEPLCEGDTTVIINVLSLALAADAFDRLLDEVSWAGMSHMGGEVPRRIAVQGTVQEDGTMPVYRHPADESPPLLPFSTTVAQIKDEIEKHLGHPLNHVLVQHYRNGNDYISEHSDKTLDVVKDSYICNVSLGAERTMVFRTKRQPKDKTTKDDSDDAATPVSGAEKAKRQVQRTPLPHNSLCRMGLKTNEKWSHAIRQDKRSDKEKSASELAYNGQRISLTFRQIGTFIDGAQSKIWGQGATSKQREGAKPVINGQTPEAVRMLQAFGTENHSSDFDWEAHYGNGFDVLHMGVPKRFCSGSDPVANARVGIALAELGVSCAKGSVEGDVRFEDNDASRAVVDGHASVLRYLDAVYGAGRRYDQMLPHVVAKRFGLLQRALDFVDLWRQDKGNAEKAEGAESLQRTKKVISLLVWEEMVFWEGKAKEAVDEGKKEQKDDDENKVTGTVVAVFICGGTAPSPVDFALWPVLHDMVQVLGDNVFDVVGLRGNDKSAYLREYYLAFKERSAVAKVLGFASVGDEAK